MQKQREQNIILVQQNNRQKFKILWNVLISLIVIGLVLFSIIITNKLTTKVRDSEKKLELVFRTLHQLIESNTALSSSLELEPDLFELELESQNPISSGIESDTFAQLVDEMYKNYQDELLELHLAEFLELNSIHSISTALGLKLYQKSNSLILLYEGTIVATLSALFDTSKNYLQAFAVQSDFNDVKRGKINIDELEIVMGNIKNSIELNLANSKQFLNRFKRELSSSSIKKLIRNYNLTIVHNTYSKFTHSTLVSNSINEPILDITLDELRFLLSVNGNSYSASQSVAGKMDYVIDTILNASYIAKQETLNQKYLKQLKSNFSSEEIQNFISDKNLFILKDWHLDNDYYYFDINTSSNHPYPQVKIGSLALQRSNGQLWMMDKDDIPVRDIFISVEAENNSKTLPFASQMKNILIIGTHNNLADSLILANMYPTRGVKLLSIPRDMHYKGNKVNWYYKYYTKANFLKIVEQIVGLDIEYYVSIDMYAFITLVDKIGGIKVHLEQDLIDPSYKIKENGKWSYINYSKGEYYLNGIEALRIARSRNTTNDFSRSSRQLLILESIRDKVNNLDIFSSMISLMQILIKIKPYINTNLKLIEIASIISKYKSTQLNKTLTLSTSNILYQTFTKLYASGVKDRNTTNIRANISSLNNPTQNREAYILLPKNNDWTSLRLFIRNYILE